MSFGFDWRHRLNGAEAYILVFQLASLLPGLYIFLAAGYMALAARETVFFAVVGFALVLGLLSRKLLREGPRAALLSRYAFGALIAADLGLRLLPLGINRVFPAWAAAAGFAVRLVCLGLVVLDLRAEKIK